MRVEVSLLGFHKLPKSTTKISAYMVQTNFCPSKGQRFTNSVIHVVVVNKVTETDTQKTEVDKTETEATESTNTGNRRQTLSKSASLLPNCTDQNIQRIIDKYETVFVGEGKLNTQQVKLHNNEEVKPVVQPQRRIPYHMRKEV